MNIEGYTITALVAFAGTYGVRMASRYFNRRLSLPEHNDSKPLRKIPHAIAFRLERMTRPFIRWMFYLMLAVIVLAKLAAGRLPGQTLDLFAKIWLALVLAAGAYGLAVALTIRCASCGRRLLLRSMQNPPFPTPRNQAGALSAGQFQCMYCGQHHAIH